MATVTSRRSTRPRRLRLASQMGRVPKALRRVDTSLDAEAVHRLRVALRRCRSLAALIEEVDPHPAWAEMQRLSRKLFRRLGALRDTQVLDSWVKKLTPADDPVRAALIPVLERREVEPRAQVRRAVKHFDQRAWKRLARTLERRARVVPPNSLAAQCLVLERYEELHRLHVRAVRTERPTPWHALRVSVKRFRYAVESLLPARLVAWGAGLQQMQDVLGEIHDLDVFDGFVVKETADMAPGAAGLAPQGDWRCEARLPRAVPPAHGRSGGSLAGMARWVAARSAGRSRSHRPAGCDGPSPGPAPAPHSARLSARAATLRHARGSRPSSTRSRRQGARHAPRGGAAS